MKTNQADIPCDLSLPIPVTATHQNLILRIIDIDVFTKDIYLVYVIRLPLTIHVKYNIYHVLHLPIKIKYTDSKFILILPEREYLLMDVVKQYYARLRVDEFKECKVIDNYHYVCKQNHPVQVTRLQEECEAEMLQSVRAIPASCSQRILELNQTMWTQLNGNEWLSVAPRTDTLTVLCPRQEPTDIEIFGTSKLKLENMCKGYGAKILVQAQMIVTTNNTDKDIIPPTSLDFDCSVLEDKKIKLNNIHLDLPLKNVVNRLDDLRTSSHKIEVEKLTDEQEWKIKQDNTDYQLSFLSYVGMVTASLMMVIFCYCCRCGKCFRRYFPGVSRWWKDNNPCATLYHHCIQPKIVNSIYASKESLRETTSRPSIRHNAPKSDAMDSTELAAFNRETTDTIPSGKR
jgi:hypothetical protein